MSAISITVGVASMADCVNVLYDVELLSENGTYMSSEEHTHIERETLTITKMLDIKLSAH